MEKLDECTIQYRDLTAVQLNWLAQLASTSKLRGMTAADAFKFIPTSPKGFTEEEEKELKRLLGKYRKNTCYAYRN